LQITANRNPVIQPPNMHRHITQGHDVATCESPEPPASAARQLGGMDRVRRKSRKSGPRRAGKKKKKKKKKKSPQTSESFPLRDGVLRHSPTEARGFFLFVR